MQLTVPVNHHSRIQTGCTCATGAHHHTSTTAGRVDATPSQHHSNTTDQTLAVDSALQTISSWASTAASVIWPAPAESVRPVVPRPIVALPGQFAPHRPHRRALPPLPRAAPAGSGGLDVCFVMDCTASMGPWIDAARATIKEMIRGLPAAESRKRVAVVAYRDFGHFGEAAPGVQVQPFSENLGEATRFLDGQIASGGDDEPEDVAGGLAAALGLHWVSETRTVVLVADAPCHGRKYHIEHDNYPEGDPTGLSMVRLMKAFRRACIDFTFVQLTSSTNQMQQMLKREYELAAGAENFRKFELRDLRDIIEEAGGSAELYSSPPAAVGAMLSAAVAPSLSSSLVSTRVGTATYSGAVRSAPAAPVPQEVTERGFGAAFASMPDLWQLAKGLRANSP